MRGSTTGSHFEQQQQTGASANQQPPQTGGKVTEDPPTSKSPTPSSPAHQATPPAPLHTAATPSQVYHSLMMYCALMYGCTHNPPVTHMDQLAVTHDALFFFLSLISRTKSQRTKMDPNMSSPSAGLTRSETSITSITTLNGSCFFNLCKC